MKKNRFFFLLLSCIIFGVNTWTMFHAPGSLRAVRLQVFILGISSVFMLLLTTSITVAYTVVLCESENEIKAGKRIAWLQLEAAIFIEIIIVFALLMMGWKHASSLILCYTFLYK